MNGIDRFEALAEQVVEGTFGKLFRPPLHPSDVMRRLARAMEDGALERGDRLVFPNRFSVWLSPSDHDVLCSPDAEPAELGFRSWLESLAQALSGTFSGDLEVMLQVNPEIGTGNVEISAHHAPANGPSSDTREMAAVRLEGSRPEEWALVRDGEMLVLGQMVLRVGRAPDNDIVLDDPSVSRYHLELSWRGNAYVVVDRGSSLGTVVNGSRLTPGEDVDLHFGDEIGMGRVRMVLARRP